jgi:hypothetical protein
MLSILFFRIPGGAHFGLPASIEELRGDQSKVVFALFVLAVIYIEGVRGCEGEHGRIIAPSSALLTKGAPG